MAIKHRTYRTLANAKTWDGSLLTGGETIRLADNVNIKTYVLIPVSSETPDDFLYFAPTSNPGTKMWSLVTPQGSFSHVEVVETTGQSIADNVSTVVIFNSVVEDTLGEYNNSTGEFTALYAGKYAFGPKLTTSDLSWNYNQAFIVSVLVGGVSIYEDSIRASGSGTFRLIGGPVFTTTLAAGAVITMKVYQNRGSATSLSGSGKENWLTIDRII